LKIENVIESEGLADWEGIKDRDEMMIDTELRERARRRD
jgi:hypothetical protein